MLFPPSPASSFQVGELIDKASEAFGEPMDTIKEAIPGIGMLELGMMAKNAMNNLVKVKDCAKVIQVFLQTVKRAGGELSDGFDAAKALV